MTKKQAETVSVPRFEPNQQMMVNEQGVSIVSDDNGALWRVDATTGTAAKVKFK